MKANNLLLLTDSYKVTHWKQYPPGTEKVYSYFESRGPVDNPKWPVVVFFGLQYYLKEYLEGQVVTKEKIDEAEAFFKDHFGSPDMFNRAGWEHILNVHGGRLPVVIKAVAEGTVVPRLNVLMTIENTDPACYWLTNYLETLLVQVWYPTTVATQSREMKMLLLQFMDRTASDKSLIDFKLHDFGFRGVSSVETAGLGGCAHLVNFKGTDTMAGLIVARDYYKCPMAGFSIPAAEHSTITSWGPDREKDAYANMLSQYPKGLVAVVSDSYDISNACSNIWGEQLKEQVLARDGALIIRPDSGDPAKSLANVLNRLGEKFGYTLTPSGHKLLNTVRVIQGDGISYDSLVQILVHITKKKNGGWATENVAFGSGGALLQKLNRDTLKFAFKCCNVTINGVDKPVFKAPSGDANKASKRGRMKLVVGDKGLATVSEHDEREDLLEEVFRDGQIMREITLDEVRQLAFVE
jgi:nicotinamide phosphoribosyltransferase